MDSETTTTKNDNLAEQNKKNAVNHVEFELFLKKHYDSTISLLTSDRDVTVREKPLLLGFHNFNKFGAQMKKWLDMLQAIAVEYKNQLDVAVANFKDLHIGTQWNKFNYEILGPKSRPRIFAIDTNGNQYRMDVSYNSDSLAKFIDLLLNERLFKTEPDPEPAENNELRIQTAVGANFNRLVLNNSKDVFVIFYAPRCLLSQELLSKLNELVGQLQDQDELVIMKMNAVDNYVPLEFNVVSYPRCFYINKDDTRKRTPYDRGPHSVENLLAFIAANSTKELQCWDRNGLLKKLYQNKPKITPINQILHLFNSSDIKRIINKNHEGLISVLTMTSEIVMDKKPLILVYHNFKKYLTTLEPLCDVIEEVAKTFRGKVDFAITDIGFVDIGPCSNRCGYKIFHSSAQPWIFAFDEHTNQYQMHEWLNVENLSKFAQNLLQRELPNISTPLLLKDVEPLVEIAVDANFQELVLDSNRDVLLVFAKAGCPFSKEFLHTIEELACLLMDDTDQMIVRMNVDENHVPPQFAIIGYPKCFYLRLGDKTNHIVYDSWPRTIESLIKFIAAHSTKELTHYHRSGALRKVKESEISVGEQSYGTSFS